MELNIVKELFLTSGGSETSMPQFNDETFNKILNTINLIESLKTEIPIKTFKTIKVFLNSLELTLRNKFRQFENNLLKKDEIIGRLEKITTKSPKFIDPNKNWKNSHLVKMLNEEKTKSSELLETRNLLNQKILQLDEMLSKQNDEIDKLKMMLKDYNDSDSEIHKLQKLLDKSQEENTKKRKIIINLRRVKERLKKKVINYDKFIKYLKKKRRVTDDIHKFLLNHHIYFADKSRINNNIKLDEVDEIFDEKFEIYDEIKIEEPEYGEVNLMSENSGNQIYIPEKLAEFSDFLMIETEIDRGKGEEKNADELKNSCDNFLFLTKETKTSEGIEEEEIINKLGSAREQDVFLSSVDTSSSAESDFYDHFFEVATETEVNAESYRKLENSKVQCIICEKICQHVAGFRRHIVSHDEQTLVCYKCGKLAESHNKLRIHEGACKRKIITLKGQSNEPFNHIHTRSVDPEAKNFIRCPIENCKKKVACAAEFKFHEHLDFHKGIRPYRCNRCGRDFQYYSSLYYHLNNSKGKCIIENCSLPKYAPIYTREEFYIVHQLEFNFECETCGKKFETQFKLLEHQNIHSDHKAYQCSCGLKYNNLPNFRTHLKQNNCTTDGVKIPEYCSLALVKSVNAPLIRRRDETSKNELFDKGARLSTITKKRKKKRFICPECNIEFNTGYKLRLHRETNHMERNEVCSECKRKFATPARLKAHITHSHMNQFKCNICNNDKNISLKQLRAHIRKCHLKNSDGLFECAKCGATFTENKLLLDHACSSKRPTKKLLTYYSCPVCRKSLTCRDFLTHLEEKFHVKLELEWRNEFKIDKIECKYCDQRLFYDLHGYFDHQKRYHQNTNLAKAINYLMKSYISDDALKIEYSEINDEQSSQTENYNEMSSKHRHA